MKGEDRYLYSETDEDPCEYQPNQRTVNQSCFTEFSEFYEIKGASGFGECQVDDQKGNQHQSTAKEGINEKLGGRTIPVLTAPDFNQKKCGQQRHFIK